MNKQINRTIWLCLIATLALATTNCKEDNTTPDPHTGTITAFGRTINVKGDASISAADFETAKTNLEEAIIDLSSGFSGAPQYITMMSRSWFEILIKTGNAGPNADANKCMTIGVGYLLVSNIETIKTGINTLVLGDNAFAD